MIRHARAASKDYDNVMFVTGSAQQIPWEENFFDKVLSVESFYYYADQDRALAELFRVMAPRGELYILINLYKDNHYSLRWVDELKVPVHVRSEQEYIDLLKTHTFEDVRPRRIPDLSPTPEVYSGKWFKDADELRDFKRIGALLLIARKPDFQSPPPGYHVYEVRSRRGRVRRRPGRMRRKSEPHRSTTVCVSSIATYAAAATRRDECEPARERRRTVVVETTSREAAALSVSVVSADT